MKLKIKITGQKVHGVGYRYFLMDAALDLGIRGYTARNRTDGGEQQVIAFIEGDEEAISDFKKIAETTHPEGAEASSVSFSDYQGEVMGIGEYYKICTARELCKAASLLRDITIV